MTGFLCHLVEMFNLGSAPPTRTCQSSTLRVNLSSPRSARHARPPDPHHFHLSLFITPSPGSQPFHPYNNNTNQHVGCISPSPPALPTPAILPTSQPVLPRRNLRPEAPTNHVLVIQGKARPPRERRQHGPGESGAEEDDQRRPDV